VRFVLKIVTQNGVDFVDITVTYTLYRDFQFYKPEVAEVIYSCFLAPSVLISVLALTKCVLKKEAVFWPEIP